MLNMHQTAIANVNASRMQKKKQKIGEGCDDVVVHCRFARGALDPLKTDRCAFRASKRTICTLKLFVHLCNGFMKLGAYVILTPILNQASRSICCRL